ncbi:MAG: RraA family protein [Methanobacteriaceae archaeon]|nr:RraA family protein [Methanobacteriaceae archaeon]
MKGKITPKNLLGKNNTKKEKITLDNLITKVSTNTVADAIKNTLHKKGVIEGVKPLNNKDIVMGKVVTVKTSSDDWGTSIKAIYGADKNDILLIQCDNDEYAIWGEMASQAAKKHGLKATIIIGASRDTNEILNLNYPVYSKSIRPNSGFPKNEGIINERLIIDDMVVCSNDIVVADVNGVVIIPSNKVDIVLEEVNNIITFENQSIKKLLESDDSLVDILNI